MASAAHVLLLTLDNGTVWNPALLEAGSPALAALLDSLAAADDGAGGQYGMSEASGWRAQLVQGGLSSVGVALLRNDSTAAEGEECGTGCAVLQLTVPQLVGYQIAADETLRLRISGSAVGLDGGGAEALGEPALHIRAEKPCEQQPSCAACTAWGRAPSRAHERQHECGWCATDRSCAPVRDAGSLRGDCSGLLVDHCEVGGGGGGWVWACTCSTWEMSTSR